MSSSFRHAKLFGCSLPALAVAAGIMGVAAPAQAADATAAVDAAASAPAGQEQEVDQVVVTATAAKAAAVAPVRPSLTEVEPEAVITRKFMEETAPRVGDFSTIAEFAPSMIAIPQPNGPGLSDGGKITLRGFADGQYNITFDGVAWGDTNGPSHHGTAFFPNSTIGGVIIDRGPGRADDMGPANFGGQVNLLSLPLEETPSFAQVYTTGSFDENQFVTTLQSGAVSQLHDAKFVANFQELSANGYLTNNYTHGNVQMFKGAVPLTNSLTLTGFYTHTFYLYYKSDIGDADVAQLDQYGKNFSLGSDPTLQDYYGYNWARKQTNFDYIKLSGDLGYGFGIDNTLYNFGYDNDTHSGENNLAAASANFVTPVPGPTYPALGKTYPTSLEVYGIPGYLKKNEYTYLGDIAKFTYTMPFGKLTFGSNYERTNSYRFIVDVNMIPNASGGYSPDYREKAATEPGPSNVYVDVPLNDQYIEFSGWRQYQPFVEFDWKPMDNLTVTPGVKYVHWDLDVNAPVEKLSTGSQPLQIDRVFTRTIPFLTANYRITNDWSAYAEYAQGMLLPNIGNLYVGNANDTHIVPQLSTNYQLGSVYSHGNISLDGDVYYIVFQNKIQSFTDPTTGQPYDTNSGGAIYKGVELEATYVLPFGFSLFGNYSYNSAIGDNDRSNPLYNGHQLTSVPLNTEAVGLRVEHDNLFRSDDAFIATIVGKFVGSEFTINASCSNVISGVCQPGSALTPVTGILPAYNQFDLSMTYRMGRYSIEGQVLNLLDSSSATSIKGKNLLANGQYDLTDATFNGSANTNAPEYQVPTSFQVTLKAKF